LSNSSGSPPLSGWYFKNIFLDIFFNSAGENVLPFASLLIPNGFSTWYIVLSY